MADPPHAAGAARGLDEENDPPHAIGAAWLPESLADIVADKCGKREEDYEMGLHSLEEVEEMKKAFLRQIAIQREPEVATVTLSDVSDHSMSAEELEEDDLLDYDEEYQKEVEEQRISDEKNGHFEQVQQPPALPLLAHTQPPPPRRTSPSSDKVLAKVAAFESRLSRNGKEVAVVGEVGKLMGDVTAMATTPATRGLGKCLKYGRSDGEMEESTAAIHTSNHYQQKVKLGSADLRENIAANYGGSSPNLLGNGKRFFGKCIPTENITPSSMKCGLELNAQPPASHASLNGENNACLDLVEVRTLVEQQLHSGQQNGPTFLGSSPHAPGQVGLSLVPVEFNSNSSLSTHLHRPNTAPKSTSPPSAQKPTHLHTKQPPRSRIPIPKPPAHFKINSAPSFKLKSKAQSSKNRTKTARVLAGNQPATGTKTAFALAGNQPASVLAGKVVMASPLADRSQPPKNSQHPAASPSTSASLQTSDEVEFPPLPPSSSPTNCAQIVGINCPSRITSPFEDGSVQSPKQNLLHGHLKSWANMVDTEIVLDKRVGVNSQNDQLRDSAEHNKGSPNIFFGRSMADVLKSGQPTDGPILLDREKSDKIGEVRIVEGKPCLFFSANETSLLAGRLGPAIVGKFSHSIPPAHQIQKALGNLKLVGTMSWNFLNAKHIFIQLSDKSDYVKLLNGPNNSPVWYVEHHPMRVFKWTPDFDPFFEIPIVAIWCNILALPVHLFEESSLIAIGEMLGKPVQVDRATITRSRVSFARICVEVDLSRPIVDEIDIDIAGKHVKLKVKWDKIPLYCSECKHVGHSASTCYASGRRPMPPKRDYSQRPSPQNRPPPNREGDSHQAGPSTQPQGPRSQPTERPPSEVGQPLRQERRKHGFVIREPAPGPVLPPGLSSAAAEGSQAAWDDGFVVPKKKKNNRNAAYYERRRERHREKMQAKATSARTVSEGEGQQGLEGDESSSGSERRSRSRAPSITRGIGYGPLAMVLHGDNMFGALEDFPSDEAEVEVDSDDHQDHMICEVPNTRLESDDPVLQYIGPTSPPAEGSSKKARLSASGAY